MGAAGDDAAQLAIVQKILVPLWQSPYPVGTAYFATDVAAGTHYAGHFNDCLWNDNDTRREALNWLINYIPTSSPPLINFASIPASNTR
jgi:hypothetical protein